MAVSEVTDFDSNGESCKGGIEGSGAGAVNAAMEQGFVVASQVGPPR